MEVTFNMDPTNLIDEMRNDEDFMEAIYDLIVNQIDFDELRDSIPLESIAGCIDLEDLAGELDAHAIADELSVSAVAAEVDLDELVAQIDVYDIVNALLAKRALVDAVVSACAEIVRADQAARRRKFFTFWRRND